MDQRAVATVAKAMAVDGQAELVIHLAAGGATHPPAVVKSKS